MNLYSVLCFFERKGQFSLHLTHDMHGIGADICVIEIINTATI